MPGPFFSVRKEVKYVQEESGDPFAGDSRTATGPTNAGSSREANPGVRYRVVASAVLALLWPVTTPCVIAGIIKTQNVALTGLSG